MNLNLEEPHVSGITQNMSFCGWLSDDIVVKNLPAMQDMQDSGLISELGRSLGEGNDNPLH